MSTMAAPAADTPGVTWRDAITPLSRASRRRWTAGYALLLGLLALSIVDDAFAVGRGSDEQIPLVLVAALAVVFGMLRRGTRQIAALDHADLDERDVEARNSAYRIAFPLLAAVVIGTLALLALALPDAVRDTRALDGNVVPTDGWLLTPEALIGLGLWFVLWALFLPTGALAWREPDAVELEAPTENLREPLRDGLLGVAIAGGVAISLLANSDAGVWPFVAALALLGGLGRRAAGQPMLSRQRKWRVAIGLGMIAILVVVALVTSSAGG